MDEKVEINAPAPDFCLNDVEGERFCLSHKLNEKIVMLVFNRGFFCPFCRRHMMHLKAQHKDFAARGIEVVIVGPEEPDKFKEYWHSRQIPYTGVPDPTHEVLLLYNQQVKMLKMGRLPALAIIDKKGIIRYLHYGGWIGEIPDNAELLASIDDLIAEERNASSG